MPEFKNLKGKTPIKTIENMIKELSGLKDLQEARIKNAETGELLKFFAHLQVKHFDVLQKLSKELRCKFFSTWNFLQGQYSQIGVLNGILHQEGKYSKEENVLLHELVRKDYVETGKIWEDVAELLGKEFMDICKEPSWYEGS